MYYKYYTIGRNSSAIIFNTGVLASIWYMNLCMMLATVHGTGLCICTFQLFFGSMFLVFV
jgi:hypothetical protein